MVGGLTSFREIFNIFRRYHLMALLNTMFIIALEDQSLTIVSVFLTIKIQSLTIVSVFLTIKIQSLTIVSVFLIMKIQSLTIVSMFLTIKIQSLTIVSVYSISLSSVTSWDLLASFSRSRKKF